jgi:ligand-binding sensor domain-containing protein
MRRAWWILLLGMLLAACGSKSTSSTTDPVTEPGTDAGTNVKPPAPPITNGAFTHYGMESGFPSFVKDAEGYIVSGIMDVSGDAAGNIWIAGGDGLYLFRSGSIQLEKFTQANGLQKYAILSVAGLGANEVMVGYQGEFGGLEDNDPPEMVMSGGADRVLLDGNALHVTHYTLGTPPGPGYPSGRYKIRSVYTIRATYDGPYAGDVWFGGNHGVAMWNQAAGAILEHQAASIETPSYMSGDHFGLAFDNVGDVWIGGAHRIGKIPYATSGGDFFAELDPVVDVWPDKSPVDRKDDHVRALAVDTAGDVWVGSMVNGLARYSAAGVCQQSLR